MYLKITLNTCEIYIYIYFDVEVPRVDNSCENRIIYTQNSKIEKSLTYSLLEM